MTAERIPEAIQSAKRRRPRYWTHPKQL